jgi:tryptophan-rich sensory protein
VRFRPISTPGFVLMLPYLAWVSFAWILNAGFWWLN